MSKMDKPSPPLKYPEWCSKYALLLVSAKKLLFFEFDYFEAISILKSTNSSFCDFPKIMF